MGDFLRKMDWLGRDRAVAYLRIVAFLDVALIVLLAATSHHGVDRNGFLLGTDFLSFWTSGRMLHHGADVYDVAAHITAQREFFAPAKGFTAFFYPPSFLPFCWPLGLLGYFPALATWLAATATLYVLAVRQWQRGMRIDVPAWLLFAAFPAVTIVFTHGQTALLLAGLLGLGLWLVPQRPLLAGLLLGLATIKPQFGLLVPVALLVTREWKVIASAVLAAVALGALSAVLFGPDLWHEWLATSGRAQAAMEAGSVPFGKFVTPFAALRLLGGPVWLAYAVQAAVTAALALLIGRLAWGRAWSPCLAAAVLAAAPLATPFALDYDMALLAFPLLWLTGEGLRTGFRSWEKLAVVLVFIIPVFSRPLGLNLGLPAAPAVLALLLAMIYRRAMFPAEKGT